MKPSTAGSAAALLASVVIHGALLLLPVLGPLRAPRPTFPAPLPTSVAMVGNSIEVEAPATEVTPAPAAPAAPNAEPVDVSALPAEPALVREPDAPAAPASPPPRSAKATRRPRPAAAPSITAPSSAAAPEQAADRGVSGPAAGTPAPGTFGQEGLPPGIRRLGQAFARAIPKAAPGDSAWRELPTGHVGTIRIELDVDENNRLGPVKRWQGRPGEPPPPAILERMVERTLILLRAGQFALSGSNQAGSERLLIDVTVRDEAADAEGAPVVVQLTHEAAAPGRPGRAYFRYGTGRSVEAKVTVVRSGR